MKDDLPQAVTHSRAGLALRLFALAVGTGAAAGLCEALWLWSSQSLRGQVIFTSDYILWMTPLLYALMFAVAGFGLVVLAMLLYPRLKVSHGVGLLVILAVGLLFLPVTQIARWAAGMVALGAGVQCARLASARPRLAARLGSGVLAGLVGLGVVARIIGFGVDRVEVGELERDDLPNVLLIVWDTVRSENLSVYGYEEPTTPGLEALAGQSAIFENAIAPSPWTLPTHASLFTGRLPYETSATWFDKLDDEHPTLAEVLSSHGYATGGFVANHHYTSYDSGLARGFQHYTDYHTSMDQFLKSSWFTQTRSGQALVRSRSIGDVWRALRMANFWVPVKRTNDRQYAHEINAHIYDWLDELDPDRPFFAFLNYFDAHQAYWSPPGYVDRFTSDHPEIRRYDAAISYLDEQLGELLDRLDESGRLDNTIVVVTSDHGELFGENGLYGHAHNLYYRTVHVPLLIHAPAAGAVTTETGARIGDAISLRDVPSTILEMAGIENRAGIAGSSLTEFWQGLPAEAGEDEANARPDVSDTRVAVIPAEVEAGRNNEPEHPISRGAMRSVFSDGMHYILNGDGVEELYAYTVDSAEASDLAGDAEHATELQRLRDLAKSVWPPTTTSVAGNPAAPASSGGPSS